MYVIYWRCVANVVDLRKFKDVNELKDWLVIQSKLEPTALIGIYDKETRIDKVEKDYERFCEYFSKGELNGEYDDYWKFVKSIN